MDFVFVIDEISSLQPAVTGRALYPLRDADAVIMRTDPPVNAAYLLRLLSRSIVTAGS